MTTQGTCKDCKYWDQETEPGTRFFGRCRHSEKENWILRHVEGGFYESHEDHFFPNDFGCIHHKHKEGEGDESKD